MLICLENVTERILAGQSLRNDELFFSFDSEITSVVFVKCVTGTSCTKLYRTAYHVLRAVVFFFFVGQRTQLEVFC